MDYATAISNATNTKNASYDTYNQYQQQANQAGTDYDTAFNNRQNYGDIYDAASDKYLNTDEINADKTAYTNARNAVDQVNTTINKLPQSIAQQYGGTGLTEAQRERAMSDQYSNLSNTANYLGTNYTNASTDYNTAMQNALNQVNTVAAGNYQGQQDSLSALQSAWATLLGQSNSSYNNYQNDLSSLYGIQQNSAADQLARDQLAEQKWEKEQDIAQAAADRQSNYNLQSYLASLQYPALSSTPTAPDSSSVTAPTQQTGAWDDFLNTIGSGLDSWGTTFKNNGLATLIGKGTFW